jgi:hypothetical protein
VGDDSYTGLAGDDDATIGPMSCIVTSSCARLYDGTVIGELSCIGTRVLAQLLKVSSPWTTALGPPSDEEACLNAENAELSNLVCIGNGYCEEGEYVNIGGLSRSDDACNLLVGENHTEDNLMQIVENSCDAASHEFSPICIMLSSVRASPTRLHAI